MDFKLLMIYSLMGAGVRSVAPIRTYPTDPVLVDPCIGDTGRVVGIVQVPDSLRILVLMDDSDHDWEELSYSDFERCFAIDPCRRKLKTIL